jgi:pentapeptide MXKDX repeat protein
VCEASNIIYWQSAQSLRRLPGLRFRKQGELTMKKITQTVSLMCAILLAASLSMGVAHAMDDEDSMKDDSMGKEKMSQDGMKKDEMDHDGMKKDEMDHDSMKDDKMMGKDKMKDDKMMGKDKMEDDSMSSEE